MVGELSSSSKVDFSLLSDELESAREASRTISGISDTVVTCSRTSHSYTSDSQVNSFWPTRNINGHVYSVQ